MIELNPGANEMVLVSANVSLHLTTEIHKQSMTVDTGRIVESIQVKIHTGRDPYSTDKYIHKSLFCPCIMRAQTLMNFRRFSIDAAVVL